MALVPGFCGLAGVAVPACFLGCPAPLGSACVASCAWVSLFSAAGPAGWCGLWDPVDLQFIGIHRRAVGCRCLAACLLCVRGDFGFS